MSQFKRQRINPLPGGRNFSGAASTSLLGPPPGLLTPPVATDLSQNARHLQGGEKQRVFTGIVTSLHDYFGVVDEEVFFQLSVVKGRLPQLGEKVLVKAAYNPGQAVPWNAVKVQTLSNQPLLKSPAPPLLHVAALGQKQGILGAQPQLIFQPHRIPPLFPQKPLSLFQTSHTLHLSHLNRFPARGPHGRLDQGRSFFLLVTDPPPAMTMTPRNANSGLAESLGVLRNQGMTCLLTASISLPILWTAPPVTS